MDPIQPVVSNPTTSTEQADRMGMGSDAFMKLLLVQLQYQDPLTPMNDRDFIAQLAQLNTLEQLQMLNDTFESFMDQQNLLRGTALIGRTVQAFTQDGLVEGSVSAVRVHGGQVALLVGDIEVPLEDVMVVQE